jgi:polo-like kinase 1
MHNNLKADNI